MYRKELFYRGLSQIPVYIEDTLPNSPYYFNIVEIPKVFGPGKNSIRFNLNENNLNIYNNVDVEIIDSYGNTVYHETPEYFQSDEANIRVLTVYLYDNISNGPLTITFVGYAKLGLSGEPIPEEFKNRYNVRYTTVVDFNRFQKNTSRLLFSETPSISILETRRPYVSRSISVNDTVTISGNGIYRFQQTYPLFELPQGQSFTNDMLNGILTLTGSSFLPTFDGYDTSNFTTFNARIVNIFNSQTAVLSFPWTVSINGISSNIEPAPLNIVDVSNFTLTYNPSPVYTPINNFNSYVNLNISSLDPVSGYLKYIKLYGKSQGDLSQYELIGESLTNNTELLINSASYIQYDRSNVGYFLDSSSFQNFWSYNPTYLSASFNSSSLFNSLYLNPLVDTSTIDVLFTSNIDINFQKGSAYRLYFNYVKNTDFVLEVYMSGSAFVDKTGIGQRVFYLDSRTFGSTYLNFPIDFLSPQTGTGRLQFKILSGNFYISDISLKSGIDQGFNPSNFNSYFPINVKNRDDIYDFKVDLIDDNNQINSYEFDNTGSINIQITGSNQYIGGNDNLLPGRLNLGLSPDGGISLDGTTNTLSTYGYNSGSGWIMWSGSRLISGSPQPGSGFFFETGAPNFQYFKAVVGGTIESNVFAPSGSGGGGGGTTPTGSLMVTGSVVSNTLTFTKGDGSTFSLTVATGSEPRIDTGSFVLTSSFNSFTASINSKTGSFIRTGSANSFNSNITFTKDDGSTFTITTANDKLNSGGGNTYSGDQTLTSGKFTINDSVATPVMQGKANAKTDINYNQTAPIFTFPSGTYSALIIDGYVIGSNFPDYYSIQKVTALPTSGDIAVTQPYSFTVFLDINSPSASTDYNFVDGRPVSIKYSSSFGTASLQFSSDYDSGNARVLITNQCKTKPTISIPEGEDMNISYRTIVKAFPSV